MNNYQYDITKEFEGMRIDKYIVSILEDSSRSFVQNLINKEMVKVNQRVVKSNYKLKVNDQLEMTIPEPEKISVEPQNIPLNIVYEDIDIIVVDKPRGLVVHPAVGNWDHTLVNGLLYHCTDLSGINGVLRPGIVHRIDKDTSGLLIIAKNDKAHNELSRQFKDHTINREYIALVEGRVKDTEGTIDAPLGRNPKDRLKYWVLPEGKRAVTHYRVIKNYSKYTLLACKLETGRTHQIRVHMAYTGHPLVGDPVYGFKKQSLKIEGQLLHARLLGFIHPTSKEYMEFTSDIPSEFKDILDKLN